MVEQRLGAADREGRDDHGPAPAGGELDDLGERGLRVRAVVAAIAVGGFNHQIVRLLHRARVGEHRIVVAPEIAGEDQLRPLLGAFEAACAQQMAGAPEPNAEAAPDLPLLVEPHRREAAKRALGIVHRVQRERRLVLREPAAVGIFGVLLLQVGAVEQQDLAEVPCRLRTVDVTSESIADEPREVPGVVQMRMRQV